MRSEARRRAGGTIAVTLIVIAVTVVGCSPRPQEPVLGRGKGMVTCVQKDQGFSVTLRSQPEQVGPGGEFSLTLTVRNLSGKPREFVIPTAQEYEFRAFVRGGNEVWRYGRGAVFAQVVTTVGFQPGDDQVFKLGWSTQGVPPGEYTVDGYFMGLPEVRPAVPVAITPQQASL